MNGMTLSIIIPVYNTEVYLPNCIESILSQSFSDFEILLIDDGSKDSCGAICDEYAVKDNRIRVFHKDNGGVSSARNLGLDHASGEWIYFVDSDDELLPDGLLTLVNLVSEDADIVMGGFIEEDEKGNRLGVDKRCILSLSKKQSIISLYGGNGSFYHYCGYLWMRLLRRTVIQKFNLCFDTAISIKEDTLFLMQYICKSNGITIQTTTPVYKYHRRSDSVMGRAESGFDSKYVDSFYALVKMKHEVESLFPFFSTPVFIAKQAIMGRYDTIIGMMTVDQKQDESMKKKLSSIIYDEVGSIFLFKVRRRLRKLSRLVRNKQ